MSVGTTRASVDMDRDAGMVILPPIPMGIDPRIAAYLGQLSTTVIDAMDRVRRNNQRLKVFYDQVQANVGTETIYKYRWNSTDGQLEQATKLIGAAAWSAWVDIGTYEECT